MTPADSEALRSVVAERLSTTLLGDVLDTMGYRRQFLPAEVRPLLSDRKLVGWAVPVLEADVFDDEDPFGLMFEALDSLRPGEVYLASGGSLRYALWGELMTTAAIARGAAGAVLNGYVRDTARLLTMGFPLFARGSYGQDQRARGRVVAYRVPIEVGGVRVEPGDLLVGDLDGVVAVPASVVAEAVQRALEKSRSEGEVREALVRGESVVQTFRRFGVM